MPGASDADESPGPGAAAVSAEFPGDRAAGSLRLSDALAEGPGPEDRGSPGRRRQRPKRRRRRRRRRRARRRRGGWSWLWPWPWPWRRRRQRRRQEPQLEGRRRRRRGSSPGPHAGSPGQVASCGECAEVAAPSPSPSLPRARGSRRRRRRRRLRAVELENLVANTLLLKARQGGCTTGARLPAHSDPPRIPDPRRAPPHGPPGGTSGSARRPLPCTLSAPRDPRYR